MKYHTWQHIATVAFPFIKATERTQKSLENKTLLPWHQQKTFQSFFLFTLRHFHQKHSSIFLPYLSDIARPRRELTQNNLRWTWGKTPRDDYKVLKRTVTTTPVLSN